MHRSIIIFGIVTALTPGVVVAAEDASRNRGEQTRQARRLAAGTVITNDLLERLYGPAASEPPSGGTETAPGPYLPDPLQALDLQLARRRESRMRLARAEDRVERAERSLQALESRRLAVANPYLPRPVLTAGEAEGWEGLDNAARLRITKEAIAAARVELEAAREGVQRLRRGG